jgi:hypothetical protein
MREDRAISRRLFGPGRILVEDELSVLDRVRLEDDVAGQETAQLLSRKRLDGEAQQGVERLCDACRDGACLLELVLRWRARDGDTLTSQRRSDKVVRRTSVRKVRRRVERL